MQCLPWLDAALARAARGPESVYDGAFCAPPMPDSAPNASDERSLRRALGRFATGVTVVTCRDRQGHPCGITVNSFSSVSLAPPLILWNIARVSNSFAAFVDAPHFVVNVLAEHQHELAVHFARSDHTLFDGIDWQDNAAGVPVLPGSIATFACRRYAIYPGGDHDIVVGEVTDLATAPGAPLLFHDGRYAAVARQLRDDESPLG